MASVPTDGDQDNNNSEPLKYKTWVLKVSIHCEGCKRKVKRILHSVEGVYTIDVDARQHKIVVTGNVDANTLLRKLEKSGKHAELWPQNHCNNNNNQVNEQPPPQQQPQEQQEVPQNQNQNPNIEPQRNNESQKVAENCGQPPQKQPQQVRFEANAPGEPQKPPGGGESGGGGGGGAKKKKKKKKGQNSNNTTNNPNTNGANNNNQNTNNNNGAEVANVVMEQGPNNGPPSTESQQPDSNSTHNPNPNPNTMSPSRQHPPSSRVYEYPPQPYYAPPPVYAVSYNTAYPSSSYSASYYSAPPPYSYAYVHQGGDVEGPAPLDWNPHVVPPSDSFEMFSDENPNACAVM